MCGAENSAFWVFPSCLHKCVCTLCMRKLRRQASDSSSSSNDPRGGIPCPLCRVVSKPVKPDFIEGDVPYESFSDDQPVLQAWDNARRGARNQSRNQRLSSPPPGPLG